ncbi:MAG: type II toxin-antitoxin system RelE/ParE family toxin [Rhodospirillales bacterium]|nr:type II toxin-antitoxin system RelE/ParE family toxin [Rhodospirillales bacterium]
MRLQWTRPALNDLSDIYDYISEHNPIAALKIARTIRIQAKGLTTHPMIGRPGRVKGTRELVVTGHPYMMAYRVTEETIDLLAVRHMARLWPEDMD